MEPVRRCHSDRGTPTETGCGSGQTPGVVAEGPVAAPSPFGGATNWGFARLHEPDRSAYAMGSQLGLAVGEPLRI